MKRSKQKNTNRRLNGARTIWLYDLTSAVYGLWGRKLNITSTARCLNTLAIKMRAIQEDRLRKYWTASPSKNEFVTLDTPKSLTSSCLGLVGCEVYLTAYASPD